MTSPALKIPKVPTIKTIEGWWAYSIQGLMRAQNPIGRSLDVSNIYPLAVGFSVNLAGAALLPTGNPPQPPSTTLNPTQPSPELTAFRPIDFQNPYSAGAPTGYYPFSEVGYLYFGPPPANLVDGWLRENTAGYDSNDNGHFGGSYLLDANGVTGVYTQQFTTPTLTNHIWDYHFVIVNDHMLKVQAAGRLPRPAVATGTLRRMG